MLRSTFIRTAAATALVAPLGLRTASATSTDRQLAATAHDAVRARATRVAPLDAEQALARAGASTGLVSHLRRAAPAGPATDNPLQQWATQQWNHLPGHDQAFLDQTLADLVPALDAVLHASANQPAHVLPGKAGLLHRTLDLLREFWQVDASRVELVGMDASVYGDLPRLHAVYEHLGLPADEAGEYARLVRDWFATSPSLQTDNPLLTHNLFASAGFGSGPWLPDVVVVGEGMRQACEAVGYGDVGGQLLVAHEFAHHVQVATGTVGETTWWSPRLAREVELFADACAGYFAGHVRGLRMPVRRVQDFLALAGGLRTEVFGAELELTSAQHASAVAWGHRQHTRDLPRTLVAAPGDLEERFRRELGGLLD